MTTDATDSDLQPAIADELKALADVLEALAEDRWEEPSLCAGWRIREVVAHVTMPARYSLEQYGVLLQEHQFDFTSLSNAVATKDAGLPIPVLLENLRSQSLHEWAPPGGGYRGALNHAVIHGLDATLPLGVQRRGPEANLHLVLDDLAGGGGHQHFGTELEGRRLEATDLEWWFGSGAPLRGTAGELAVAVAGRSIPGGGLQGEPLARR